MARKTKLALRLLCCVVVLLCLTPLAAQRSKKYYEKYYYGPDGTQYFIKPFALESDSNEIALVDILFRYKDEIKDSAVINISFFSKDGLKYIDSIRLGSKGEIALVKKAKFLFAEKSKGKMLYRYTCKAPVENVRNLFAARDWIITVYKVTGERIFSTPKKSKRRIKKINSKVFSFM